MSPLHEISASARRVCSLSPAPACHSPHLHLCSPHLPACNAPSPSACVTPARLGTAVTQHLHEDLRSSTGLFLTWNPLIPAPKAFIWCLISATALKLLFYLCLYVWLLDWKLLEGRGHVFCFSVSIIQKNHSINIFRPVDLYQLTPHCWCYDSFYKWGCEGDRS